MWTIPDASLTDVDGKPHPLRQGQRPVTVVFFGYTNCPDVCTGVLTDLAAAISRMEESARAKVQVVLVTTDPARDTPAVLKEYLRRIDPTFVGLTGTLPQVLAVAKPMGVEIEKAVRLPSGGYEITHGTQLVAYGPDFTSRVVWTPGSQIGDLRADLEKVVASA